MKSIINGITTSCIVLLSSVSSAEPPAFDESQNWVPSLAITSGMLVEDGHGAVASTVRPSATGSETLISPWLGGSLELMSPAWDPLGGRTRFFVHGGLGANFGFKRDLAKEGAPGAFNAPDIPGITDDTLVQGQGSVTDAQPTGLVVTAGAGLSITIETERRRFRIKPSLEYLLEEVGVGGRVHRATLDDPSVPSFNFIVITGNEKKYFHGLGPGLEVEADIARAGPVLVALLASGSAFRILGDRDVQFSSTDATGTESATWSYRKDAWSYRAHVGLRFRWVPDP